MDKKFTIEVIMEERWVDDFCSFLKYIEKCGIEGSSRCVGFYADGDGDFRPRFKIDTDFNQTKGLKKDCVPIVTFDAG